MLINDSLEYEKVWDRVYEEFRFRPTIDIKVIPFVINSPHIVYDISKSWGADWERLEPLITDALIRCTLPGGRLYALDWHHSAFLYDPRDPEQMKSIDLGNNICAFFPPYFPDGDYYFFIDEEFRFGYLSHPLAGGSMDLRGKVDRRI